MKTSKNFTLKKTLLFSALLASFGSGQPLEVVPSLNYSDKNNVRQDMKNNLRQTLEKVQHSTAKPEDWKLIISTYSVGSVADMIEPLAKICATGVQTKTIFGEFALIIMGKTFKKAQGNMVFVKGEQNGLAERNFILKKMFPIIEDQTKTRDQKLEQVKALIDSIEKVVNKEGEELKVEDRVLSKLFEQMSQPVDSPMTGTYPLAFGIRLLMAGSDMTIHVHAGNRHLMHSKMMIVKAPKTADSWIFVGSNNMSKGGLTTYHEGADMIYGHENDSAMSRLLSTHIDFLENLSSEKSKDRCPQFMRLGAAIARMLDRRAKRAARKKIKSFFCPSCQVRSGELEFASFTESFVAAVEEEKRVFMEIDTQDEEVDEDNLSENDQDESEFEEG